MAAPESKTIHNLEGKWQMNKSLSGPFETILALQGVGFLVRKGINAATVTLHVKQHQAPPDPAQDPIEGDAATEPVEHIDIDQTITGGIKGTSEKRCADNRRREHTDWLFGHVSGRTLFYKTLAELSADFPDPFLVEGLEEQEVLVSHVVNLDAGAGWVATQVWGFKPVNGERRYVRNVVVTKGEGSKQQRVAVTLVYDFVGEL